MNLAARVIGGLALAGVVGATLASPAPASAQAQGAQQVTIPAPTILNPCNGELIVATGLQHFVVLSKGGNLFIHQNFQNVSGVGQTTQTQYVISGSSELHASVNPKTGHAVFTDISVLHIISVGTGQNLISTIVVHTVGTKVVTHDTTRCTDGNAAQVAAAAETSTAGSPTALAPTSTATASIPGTTSTTSGTSVTGTSTSALLASMTPSHRWASMRGIQHSIVAPGQQHSAASANTQSTASGTPTSPSSHSHRLS